LGLFSLGKAEWTSSYGGLGGDELSLNCSNHSWIDYVEGGAAYWSSNVYQGSLITQFNARCSNGESLENRCGSDGDDFASVSEISNQEGFGSVSLSVDTGSNNNSWISNLIFYYEGDFVGAMNGLNTSVIVACPEDEVIFGLELRCGGVMDAIRLYCDTYQTETPTTTPTTAPTISPTATPITAPTISPTATPTTAPTISPTAPPTTAPTDLHKTLYGFLGEVELIIAACICIICAGTIIVYLCIRNRSLAREKIRLTITRDFSNRPEGEYSM